MKDTPCWCKCEHNLLSELKANRHTVHLKLDSALCSPASVFGLVFKQQKKAHGGQPFHVDLGCAGHVPSQGTECFDDRL